MSAAEHRANCSCGQLQATAVGDPVRVSICHCLACQRRTGSAYGIQARFPRPQVRITGERRLFALELGHYVFPAGRVLTTDDFRGANLELPPGGWKMPGVPLSAAIGWVRVFGMRLPQASRTQLCFERGRLQEPHYYIRYVGVTTRMQGQGLGTALLSPTLDRCDRESLPAYLEASSERSAALYERLGFVHLGELRVPGGPPFWPMRRPPAAA